jgi:hypothetical protein
MLIDSAPELMFPAADRDHNLVQVPMSPRAGARRRMRLDYSRPNFSAQLRTVSWLTSISRDASISSIIRRLSGNRKLSQTAYPITSAGKRWRR